MKELLSAERVVGMTQPARPLGFGLRETWWNQLVPGA
jgi:hypothetical protein